MLKATPSGTVPTLTPNGISRNRSSTNAIRRSFNKKLRTNKIDFICCAVLEMEKSYCEHLMYFMGNASPRLKKMMSKILFFKEGDANNKTIFDYFSELIKLSKDFIEILEGKILSKKSLILTICDFFDAKAKIYKEYLIYWEWLQQAIHNAMEHINHFPAIIKQLEMNYKTNELAKAINQKDSLSIRINFEKLIEKMFEFSKSENVENSQNSNLFYNKQENLIETIIRIPILRIQNYDKFLYNLLGTVAETSHFNAIVRARSIFSDSILLLDKFDSQLKDLKDLAICLPSAPEPLVCNFTFMLHLTVFYVNPKLFFSFYPFLLKLCKILNPSH